MVGKLFLSDPVLWRCATEYAIQPGFQFLSAITAVVKPPFWPSKPATVRT
jgi:hypothetical protein